MKTERLFLGILTFSMLLTPVLPAATGPSGDLRAALERAGGNRAELEAALLEMKGTDTKYLILHASQYDLVNLTARQIVENVTYARKVHDEALPYLGEKLDDNLWRDWVLPHRVMDEDLCLWRKEFYERMQPVIAGKATTAEVAEAIHDWLLVPGETEPQLEFDARPLESEPRLKTPVQMLRAGKGRCGELCMVYVYLLRSVGIPARHCSVGFYTSRDDGHLYCEYWDSQLKQWTAVDASVEYRLDRNPPRKRVESGEWSALAMYAYPGHPRHPDLYGTAFWNQCVPVTENLMEPNRVFVAVPESNAGVASANVWNCGVWRATARVESAGGSGSLELAKIKPTDRPVLFTAVSDDVLSWKIERPTMDDSPIPLEAAQEGKCLRWLAHQ
jgi:hypothetical protein